jgi:hypothetical protein
MIFTSEDDGLHPVTVCSTSPPLSRHVQSKNLALLNPSHKFAAELRKRIVARSHDHNTIAAAGQSDKSVAAGAAIRICKSFSTTSFNFAYNVAASNAAVDSSAEIYRLGHRQDILIV